jgi:hypothetical protein
MVRHPGDSSRQVKHRDICVLRVEQGGGVNADTGILFSRKVNLPIAAPVIAIQGHAGIDLPSDSLSATGKPE